MYQIYKYSLITIGINKAMLIFDTQLKLYSHLQLFPRDQSVNNLSSAGYNDV